ncbi:MAG: hypothetical protein WGN25_13660 [Candidatus Electrothrix sp. GW3-4]|uniref:hypothetical protein n=1 Tax=Candidatus Electrothrix sp. GW3-4 TaxID=3126740 RepID=UPI0030D10E98
MEPVITSIAAAVALGAAAGLKDTASKAVTDAYAGLKKLIQDRYNKDEDVTDAFDYLVKKPEAEGRQQELAKALQEVEADKEHELVHAAEALLAEVEKQPGGEEAVNHIVNQLIIGDGNIVAGAGDVNIKL